MPTNLDTTKSAAIRVRDNQRRARERHKDYVRDLERRVAEYEKHGARATLEMQTAARAVVTENERLRILLERKGVEKEELKAFLKSFDDHEPAIPATQSESHHVQSSAQWDRPESLGHSVQRSEGPDLGKLEVLADASACCGGLTTCTMPTTVDTHASSTAASPMMAQIDDTATSSPQMSDMHLQSSTTMSCESAANIIAEMHGHGDKYLTKAYLGCGTEEDCTVRNTTLFQFLDQRDS